MLTHQHPEWRLIVASLKDVEYGRMISHEEIEGITGLSRLSGPSRYFRQVLKARKVLLMEHSRALRSLRDEGYTVITPEEFLDHGRQFIVKGTRRIKNGVETLAFAPADKLSDRENKMLADAQAKYGNLLHMARGTLMKTRRTELEKRADVPKLL